jgi:hypothetical protein
VDEVAHRNLAKDVRRVRFDALEPGVYQLRVRGPQATEQLATKLVVGRGDARRTTIAIEPFAVTGRVTMGGTEAGGSVTLQHREFRWRAGIVVAADGTFRAPMWQRGDFLCKVRVRRELHQFLRVAGTGLQRHQHRRNGRAALRIVRGVVRAAGALHADGDARRRVAFDRHRHSGRPRPQHLEPEAISFALDDDAPLRELDVRLEAGRGVAVVVIDKANDPIAGAKVICVHESRICARTVTDEDGRAEIAVPEQGAAMLFAIAQDGPFAMIRAGRERGRLRIHLPSPSSSLQLRALTTDGRVMPPFSLLMRFNGELVPAEVAEELAAVQGLRLATGMDSEARLRNIPSGSYEFWPYRTDEEAEAIVAAGALFAPIQVDVRGGDNKVVVKFAAR